ncbi:MAG TPA: sigma-70 family RNA polymerase sigma factor [Anaeromyxobacteraceae bacterium]|nr:sigma-70 family RNA polymerase sigma factor [Anaeromyxobacteraceae bacterium]
MPTNDTELLAAARAGDRAALERLLERHQNRVFRFGMKMCGEEDDAKDVLQETLLAAARNISDFRGASAVSTWLYTIARSFCIKKRRTSKFAPERVESLDAVGGEAHAVPDAARGPEEELAGRQVQTALQDAISELEPMYREVLVLRDVEGLSAPEVAQILELSVEAVKSRLHRARVAVRERVAPVLGAVPAPDAGCPDVVELFSKHLEGEISGDVCASLEQHLATCARCRARCDSLRATLSLCRSSGEQVPPRVERSVRDALRRFLESHPA